MSMLGAQSATRRSNVKTTGKSPSSSTTILLTGTNGQLGQAFRRHWLQEEFLDSVVLIPTRSSTLDIAERDQVQDQLKRFSPDIVINCAAYTDTARAEEDREQCWRVNALGVHHLVEYCAHHSIALVHFSTDFVFGSDSRRLQALRQSARTRDAGMAGSKEAPLIEYTEECPVAPIGYYGGTKVSAEHAIMAAALREPDFQYWIIRTAGLFEYPWRQTRNFPLSIASQLKARTDPLHVVSDIYTNLSYVPDLVRAVLWLLENRDEWTNHGPVCPKGVYHITNQGFASWCEIAKQVAHSIGENTSRIIPTTALEYHEKYARKPSSTSGLRYSVLSSQRYLSTSAPPLPHWQNSIERWGKAAAHMLR
jgi:dTDP-4-dehydrorhamnose reductase